MAQSEESNAWSLPASQPEPKINRPISYFPDKTSDEDDHSDEPSEPDEAAGSDVATPYGVVEEAEQNGRAEDNRTTEQAPETWAVSGANLKMVYDVEYQAPE